eukprot:gnl/Spiro4/9011_TR4754_c0_g1_i1.p1 gnl/Spiro4/9011_TR4754_c0_g1~~gnl/Spiro4/9011_TR4754_c0_g1_i1.p1  ORF type:complete len:887 (+),score=219.35 gnl/Spiro4/9011_TR4754_c0_g1_i1:94-2754(+)
MQLLAAVSRRRTASAVFPAALVARFFSGSPKVIDVLRAEADNDLRTDSNIVSVTQIANPRARDGSWVTDSSGVLSLDEREHINEIADGLYEDLGVEAACVTITNVHNWTPEQAAKRGKLDFWTTDMFNYWGIGDSETNTGLLMLLARQQRRIEIRTGTGLEEVLPPAWLFQMQQEHMVPYFKHNAYGQGLLSGFMRLDARLRERARSGAVAMARHAIARDTVKARMLAHIGVTHPQAPKSALLLPDLSSRDAALVPIEKLPQVDNRALTNRDRLGPLLPAAPPSTAVVPAVVPTDVVLAARQKARSEGAKFGGGALAKPVAQEKHYSDNSYSSSSRSSKDTTADYVVMGSAAVILTLLGYLATRPTSCPACRKAIDKNNLPRPLRPAALHASSPPTTTTTTTVKTKNDGTTVAETVVTSSAPPAAADVSPQEAEDASLLSPCNKAELLVGTYSFSAYSCPCGHKFLTNSRLRPSCTCAHCLCRTANEHRTTVRPSTYDHKGLEDVRTTCLNPSCRAEDHAQYTTPQLVHTSSGGGGGGGGGGCGDDEAADQAHSNSVAQLAHETIEDRLKNPALRSARDFLESLATKTGRGPNRDTCTYKSAYAQQRDEEVREAASTQRDEQLNQFLRGGGRPPGNDLWYFEKGTKKQSSGEVAKLEDEFVKHCTAKDPLSGSLETELPPEARNILASRKPALDSSLKQALKPAINNHPSMWKRRPNNPAANQLSAALGDVLEYHEQCIHDERAREVASVNRLNLEYSQRLLSLYQHFRQEVNGLSRNFQQNEEERKRSEEEFQKKLQQSNRELKIKPFDPLYKPTKHKPSNRVHFIPSPKVVRQLKHRVVKKAWRPEGTASEIQTTSQALGLDAHFAQYSEMRRARDEARRQKLR